MTSLSAGDVDGDGYEELVVGGYADANPLEGELYLACMERGKGVLDATLRGLTYHLARDGRAAHDGAYLLALKSEGGANAPARARSKGSWR